MSDTGAPWNLPYPLPTDLVRDGADAIKDLAEATATGLSAAGNAGIGSNVVQTVKTDTFTTTSTSFTAVTGLTATITPTSATSKVLVIVKLDAAINTPGGAINRMAARLTGGGGGYVGAADGSRTRASIMQGGNDSSIYQDGSLTFSMIYVDQPNTTSPTTYGVEVIRINGTGTIFVNRTVVDTDSAAFARSVSSIVAIEVAA